MLAEIDQAIATARIEGVRGLRGVSVDGTPRRGRGTRLLDAVRR